MRFALLGDHEDGLNMTRALVATGRHQLAAYSGPSAAVPGLREGIGNFLTVGDLEELLADPVIELVIVASSPALRPQHLRRALQSERHVLCVHPADDRPDLAYEAAMIQGDTRQVLLPLLPEAFHPGVRRLAGLVRAPDRPLGAPQLIEMERWYPPIAAEAWDAEEQPSLPGWDVLRVVGGEIAEVFGQAPEGGWHAGQPLLLSGRFVAGPLFRAALFFGDGPPRCQLRAIGDRAQARLTFPDGCLGPSLLEWPDSGGVVRTEAWDAWNPWPALVEVVENLVGQRPAWPGSAPVPDATSHPVRSDAIRTSPSPPPPSSIIPRSGVSFAVAEPRPVVGESGPLSWQDEVRWLELDDAVRYSIERRRATVIDYQEASEEVGFKGVMTLVGCGTLLVILFVFVASLWVPVLRWLVVPALLLFLVLQTLRWVIPRGPTPPRSE